MKKQPSCQQQFEKQPSKNKSTEKQGFEAQPSKLLSQKRH